MIDLFSLATAHLYGDAMASQAALRYRVFVQQRQLDHLHYDGLEYDEFDTPAAQYLVWRDPQGIVRGLIRLLPTTRPYMLERYWPELSAKAPLPKSDDVWEITRVCVDRNYDPKRRARILPELLTATEEFFQERGITRMIGVTRPHLLSHFIRSGIQWLGGAQVIEGEMEAAFSVPREHIRPKLHCKKYNITGRILPTYDDRRLAA